MDKIKLLNSIYLYETNEFLSPSDIVINFFDEFMIMTNFIVCDVDKIYIDFSNNMDGINTITFTIPGLIEKIDCNSINLNIVTTYNYAGRSFNVLTSIEDGTGHLMISIRRLI